MDNLPHTGRRRIRQLRQLLLEDRGHGFHGSLALKCAAAAEQLVQNYAEAEDIGAMIGFRAANLLGRHVAHRAHHHARFCANRQRLGDCGGRSRYLHLRQTEIQDFDAPVPSQQNVGGFQIPVNDPGSVCGSEPVRDLHGAIQALPQSGCAYPQRFAIDQLGNDIRCAAFHTHVVDGDDVGVIEGRHRVGLEFKAPTPIRIRCDFLGKDFQGDFAL